MTLIMIVIVIIVIIAEGAQALTRQVNYEIAALKKQISKGEPI